MRPPFHPASRPSSSSQARKPICASAVARLIVSSLFIGEIGFTLFPKNCFIKFAWGYIGSCVPFILGLGLVLWGDRIGIGQLQAMTITFVISSLWWIGATVPLLRGYKQLHYVERTPHMFCNAFHRLFETFHNMKKLFVIQLLRDRLLMLLCCVTSMTTLLPS